MSLRLYKTVGDYSILMIFMGGKNSLSQAVFVISEVCVLKYQMGHARHFVRQKNQKLWLIRGKYLSESYTSNE